MHAKEQWQQYNLYSTQFITSNAIEVFKTIMNFHHAMMLSKYFVSVI